MPSHAVPPGASAPPTLPGEPSESENRGLRALLVAAPPLLLARPPPAPDPASSCASSASTRATTWLTLLLSTPKPVSELLVFFSTCVCGGGRFGWYRTGA